MRLSVVALTCALMASSTTTSYGWVVPTPSRSTSLLSSTTAAAASTSSSGTYTLDGEELRGPITPLGNFCLVRTKDTLTATDGGILLPDQSKERPTEGIVVAAGPGKLHPHTGVRITNPVKEGDSVLYGKFDGTPLVYNEDSCQMIRDDDVMLYYQGTMMNLENAMPCRDYVLVELEGESLETSSGIAIAQSVVADDRPCQGTVLKVGEGRMNSKGEFSPSPVQPGDNVKFKDYAGNDVTIGGKPFSVVRMVDILCSFSDEAAAAQQE
jgi:chaperonin GroES